MKNFIKKYSEKSLLPIGVLLILIGIFIFISNILAFNYSPLTTTGGGLPSPSSLLEPKQVNAVAYFYDRTTRKNAAFGAVLIATGILIIKYKKTII